MKRKSKSTRRKPDPKKGEVKDSGYPVAVQNDAGEDTTEEQPITTPQKKDDTRPVSAVSVRHLKNIYGSPVNVEEHLTPSGRRYEFAPNQTLPVEPEDYHFLLSLSRNPGPGCCDGTPAEQAQRHYFGVP